MKLGGHVNFRIDVALADKLTRYGHDNDKNTSQSIIELLEFAFEIKPLIKEVQEDPSKLNEILLEIKAKESEQGLFEYINSLTEVQRNGIFKMLEMKRDGTWKE